MPLSLPVRVGFGENLFHHLHHQLDPVPALFPAERPMAVDRSTNLLSHSKLHDQRCPFGAIGHGRSDNPDQTAKCSAYESQISCRIDTGRLDRASIYIFRHFNVCGQRQRSAPRSRFLLTGRSLRYERQPQIDWNNIFRGWVASIEIQFGKQEFETDGEMISIVPAGFTICGHSLCPLGLSRYTLQYLIIILPMCFTTGFVYLRYHSGQRSPLALQSSYSEEFNREKLMTDEIGKTITRFDILWNLFRNFDWTKIIPFFIGNRWSTSVSL